MKNRTLSRLSVAAFAMAVLSAMNVGGQTETQIKILKTGSGIRFGLVGEKGPAPAPTIFAFAGSLDDALGNKDFNKAARILGQHGYLAVSLDIPCHGQDATAGELAGNLSCWRSRLEKGDDMVPDFVARASAVLDYLIQEGYTDPRQGAAYGTSRGGFIALHFAAAEPRVGWVVAFGPVTNLMALSEFAGIRNPAFQKARDLALIHVAGKLAGRPIWLCIGNDDERVSTEDAITFTRRVVEASKFQGKPAEVELHVMPTEDHAIHPTAHQEAAAWFLARMKEGK